jgi:hypothetical protein
MIWGTKGLFISPRCIGAVRLPTQSSIHLSIYDHVLSLPAQHGAVFPVILSMGRCGFARLQMKFGHMDGMHCIIDGTSIWSN